jgi:hypothetical protein
MKDLYFHQKTMNQRLSMDKAREVLMQNGHVPQPPKKKNAPLLLLKKAASAVSLLLTR